MRRQDVEFTGEGAVTLRGWLFGPTMRGPIRASRWRTASRASRNTGWSDSRGCSPRPDSWCWCTTIAASGPATVSHASMSTRGFRSPIGGVLFPSWKSPRRRSGPHRPLGNELRGRHAIVLGATDRRLRAVVAQVPTISGYEQSLRRVAPDDVAALEAGFIEDERRQFRGEPPATQAVVGADPAIPAAYRAADAIAFYNEPVPDGVWQNLMTVRSSRAARMYEPGTWISRVSPHPVADGRRVTGHRHRHRPRAGRLRTCIATQETRHHPWRTFDPYLNQFGLAAGAARDWFVEHLASTETR